MNRVTRGRLRIWCLAAALGLAALGAGAVHFPVIFGYCLLLLLAGWLGSRPVHRESDRLHARAQGPLGNRWGTVRATSVTWVLWGLLVLCWLQALPLPVFWGQTLAPESSDIWARSVRLWGNVPPQWYPLSVAPGRTLIEGTKIASYGLVFALACRRARRHGIVSLAVLVFALGLLVALTTLTLQLSGSTSLYGLYQPLNATSVTPILNNNSLAGYLNLALFAGLGVLCRSPPWLPKPLIGLGLLIVIATIVTQQSRAATALLLVGLLVHIVAPGRLHRSSPHLRRRQFLKRAATLGALTCGGAGFALSAIRQQGLGGLADSSLEKLQLLRSSAQWSLQHWDLGIGRGAFGSAFFVHQPAATSNSSYDHAENLWLQWAIEWGLPVALLAFGILAWALRPLLARSALRDPVRRALLLGCAVLLVQNTLDLGLEITAVGAFLALALGGLSGAPAQPHQGRQSVLGVPSRRTIRWGVLLTAASLALSCYRGSPLITGLRTELRTQLPTAESPATPQFWNLLRDAMRQFPADPYFPLLGSAAASNSNPPKDPLPWIAFALERGPQQATNYVQLARVLRRRGATAQALGALRQAVTLSPRQLGTVQALTKTWQLTPSQQLQLIPLGKSGADSLRSVARQQQDPFLRLDWLQQAIERDENSAEGHYELARELLFHIKSNLDSVRCPTEGNACAVQVREHLARAERPGSSRVAILRSQLMTLRGDAEVAEKQLRITCQNLPEDIACKERLVRLALGRESESLDRYVEQWVASGCTTPKKCATIHNHLGQLFISHQKRAKALAHYRQAAEQWPTARSWTQVALLAEQLSLPALAQRSSRRAKLLEPALLE